MKKKILSNLQDLNKIKATEFQVNKLSKDKEESKKEITRLLQEQKRLYELRDALEKERKFAEKQKVDVEGKNNHLNKSLAEKKASEEKLRSENTSLQEEIKGHKKDLAEKAQMLEKNKRDKESLESEIKEKTEKIQAKDQEINQKDQDLKNLDVQFKKSKISIVELEKKHHDVERARNKATEENTKLKNKIDHLLEDIKLGDNRVQELQKKVAEYEKKLKMPRN